MNRNLFIGVVVIAIIAIGGYYFLKPAKAAEVKIGFVTTLTTPAGVIGRDMKDAFELGLDDIGRKLWHHRIPITLPADTWVIGSLSDMMALPDGRIALTGQTWYGVQKNTWRHDLWLRTILDL